MIALDGGMRASTAVEAPRSSRRRDAVGVLPPRGHRVLERAQPPVVPVLVFDQFEEIFTLGGADRETQAQTAALLEELAEIIENRAPEHVKDALEADASGELRVRFPRSQREGRC